MAQLYLLLPDIRATETIRIPLPASHYIAWKKLITSHSNKDSERNSYNLCFMVLSLNWTISKRLTQVFIPLFDSATGRTLLMYSEHRLLMFPIVCVASQSLAATSQSSLASLEDKNNTRALRALNYLHCSSKAVSASTTSLIAVSKSVKSSSWMNSKHLTIFPSDMRPVSRILRDQAMGWKHLILTIRYNLSILGNKGLVLRIAVGTLSSHERCSSIVQPYQYKMRFHDASTKRSH